MNEDKIYMLRKIAVMVTCIVVFVTVGLVVVNFQSKAVTIDYYGETIQVNTMSNTIEGLLMQNGIYIDEKAVVYPNVETRITNNMQIKIYSENEQAKLDIEQYKACVKTGVVEKLIEEVQYIEYKAEEQTNANKARGDVSTIQEGVLGQKTVVYTAKYDGEQEVVKTIISEKIEKEPVNQIIEVGTKVTTVSRGNAKRITAADLTVDSGYSWYNIRLSADLQKYAYNMCKKYGVPYTTFLAMMYVESGYNSNAKSSTGYGMCQINPSNLAYLYRNIGTTNLMDPYQNIEAGAFWLGRYYRSWSNSSSGEELSLNALNSYNWGEGGYRNYLKNGRNAYSWYYGTKVLGVASRIESNGGL